MTKIVSRIWIRAILAAAVAYHTLWACSPVAQMPPPVPMAKGEALVGGALTLGSYKSDTPNPFASQDRDGRRYVHGIVWGEAPVTERLTVGGSFVTVDAGSTGALVRFDAIQTPHFVLSAQGRGGLVFYELGVPVSVGITDDLWIYAVPSLARRPFDGEGIAGTGFGTFTSRPHTGALSLGAYWTSPGGAGVGLEAGEVVYLDRQPDEHAPYITLSVGYFNRPGAELDAPKRP